MTEPQNKKLVPAHVGIIMDGNRRWAHERHLPTLEGHLRGYEKFRLAPGWFFARDVKVVSVFAFSTENWNRNQDEVNYLMKLLSTAIENELEDLNNKNYRILVSGRIDELPGNLPDTCRDLMDKTKHKKGGILNVCLNYGGRSEIVDAIKKMVKHNIDPEQVHEGIVRKYLYNGDLPDPDIIVRTSGEQRLSGFLLWQAAYSEFFFINKFWPDLEERDVDVIINEFAARNRRFGGDNKK
jgi:undecaprenyl diphosphate synthase